MTVQWSRQTRWSVYTHACTRRALIFITTRATLSHSADEQWRAWLCRPETTFHSCVWQTFCIFDETSCKHRCSALEFPVFIPCFCPPIHRGYIVSDVDWRQRKYSIFTYRHWRPSRPYAIYFERLRHSRRLANCFHWKQAFRLNYDSLEESCSAPVYV